jgi:hypothetical protein
MAHYAVVNVATNSTTVIESRAKLHAIYVDTVLSNHACPIKDGTTTVFSIVAQAAAGTYLELYGIEMSSIVVDPDDSATGGIVVIYDPF